VRLLILMEVFRPANLYTMLLVLMLLFAAQSEAKESTFTADTVSRILKSYVLVPEDSYDMPICRDLLKDLSASKNYSIVEAMATANTFSAEEIQGLVGSCENAFVLVPYRQHTVESLYRVFGPKADLGKVHNTAPGSFIFFEMGVWRRMIRSTGYEPGIVSETRYTPFDKKNCIRGNDVSFVRKTTSGSPMKLADWNDVYLHGVITYRESIGVLAIQKQPINQEAMTFYRFEVDESGQGKYPPSLTPICIYNAK